MDLKPAWIPTAQDIANANITLFMSELNLKQVKDFHRWSVNFYQDFWERIIHQLGILFKHPPQEICDLSSGIETPYWLPGAKMNIVDSCFTAPPHEIALIFQNEKKEITNLTYLELEQLTNRIAHGLIAQGYQAGDAIAIIMPMNIHAIAAYLGIIKIGAVVVSIADSFSSEEIETRLKIAKTKGIFTQEYIEWDGKKIPLYEKISAASQLKKIVLQNNSTWSLKNTEDLSWNDFLADDTQFTSAACNPMDFCNILFSSGTTAEPKAIPWNHTTPIKVASDAYFHQNIKPGDVLAWPTNLGWMMGPWLVFAALINKATIAVYPEAPRNRAFGEFIQNAKVTMLGVVPTLVATWRQTQCMENLNWQTIKVFSSTGECSNVDDMLYLMELANHKPVIEYCGGTEIGGAFVSSTVVEANYPTLFSTPVIGLDFYILDENKRPADIGEVAILPPSIGLSVTLLNTDHHQVYYENMPIINKKILRRHGDQIERLPNDYYAILGRVDDTMNLSGIKVSAAEIERALAGLSNILEVAAISVNPPENGRSHLVIFAATAKELNKNELLPLMQQRINSHLNPLFKIHDLVFVNELPKTVSNKIMRRVLRKKYLTK